MTLLMLDERALWVGDVTEIGFIDLEAYVRRTQAGFLSMWLVRQGCRGWTTLHIDPDDSEIRRKSDTKNEFQENSSSSTIKAQNR